jgi:hypothetical protein
MHEQIASITIDPNSAVRYDPPFAVAPIAAIVIRSDHRRSPSTLIISCFRICRFSNAIRGFGATLLRGENLRRFLLEDGRGSLKP